MLYVTISLVSVHCFYFTGKYNLSSLSCFQSTNAQIKVYGNVCPRSTDRVVAISGPIETCVDALRRIIALATEVYTYFRLCE